MEEKRYLEVIKGEITMEVLVDYKGLSLIKKYNNFYIRFIGGMMDEYPCDFMITKDEADSIIRDNKQIYILRDKYKKHLTWTLSYFIESAIKDFMRNTAKMNEKQIQSNLEKMNHYEDIKTEFYQTIMTEQFPIESGIRVQGYTAQLLYDTTRLSILGAYNYLIYLREDPVNAIADLKKGLPVR